MLEGLVTLSVPGPASRSMAGHCRGCVMAVDSGWSSIARLEESQARHSRLDMQCNSMPMALMASSFLVLSVASLPTWGNMSAHIQFSEVTKWRNEARSKNPSKSS
jgi:hypothetical protein